MSAMAKGRSQDRIMRKLRQYWEGTRPELELPSAGDVGRMTHDELVAWVSDNVVAEPHAEAAAVP